MRKRKQKQDGKILNTVEWLIIILLTLIVLLLSLSTESDSKTAGSSVVIKSQFCDSGKDYFIPLNQLDCRTQPNKPECRRTDCKRCPDLGSCNHGYLSNCHGGSIITGKAVRVGDNCVREDLRYDIRVVEILDQAEERALKRESFKSMGFNNNEFIGYDEIKRLANEKDSSLRTEFSWEHVFDRVVKDHVNLGFRRGPHGFELTQ